MSEQAFKQACQDEGIESGSYCEAAAIRAFNRYAAARLPDREGCPLRTAVETVLSTFRKDLEQGYRTKDKEFAIDILSMGLKLADDEQKGNK
jgi:hypothetical protein